jgi:hypothetical protein
VFATGDASTRDDVYRKNRLLLRDILPHGDENRDKRLLYDWLGMPDKVCVCVHARRLHLQPAVSVQGDSQSHTATHLTNKHGYCADALHLRSMDATTCTVLEMDMSALTSCTETPMDMSVVNTTSDVQKDATDSLVPLTPSPQSPPSNELGSDCSDGTIEQTPTRCMPHTHDDGNTAPYLEERFPSLTSDISVVDLSLPSPSQIYSSSKCVMFVPIINDALCEQLIAEVCSCALRVLTGAYLEPCYETHKDRCQRSRAQEAANSFNCPFGLATAAEKSANRSDDYQQERAAKVTAQVGCGACVRWFCCGTWLQQKSITVDSGTENH